MQHCLTIRSIGWSAHDHLINHKAAEIMGLEPQLSRSSGWDRIAL